MPDLPEYVPYGNPETWEDDRLPLPEDVTAAPAESLLCRTLRQLGVPDEKTLDEIHRVATSLPAGPDWESASDTHKSQVLSVVKALVGDLATAEGLLGGSVDRKTRRWVPLPNSELDEGPAFVVCKASKVEPVDVEWLWPGRVERGETTLIAGRPGVGKGLVAVAVCAGVTTGRALPGGSTSEPAAVAWIRGPGEDSASVLRGRLEAAGADLDRVDLVDARPSPGALEAAVRDRVDAGVDTLVVDSLAVFAMADGLETVDQSSVRRWMLQLRAAAGGATVMALAHHNKSLVSSDTDRVSGSHQFTASARGLLTVENGDEGRMLRVGKLNNGASATDLTFDVIAAENSFGTVAWGASDAVPGGGGGGGGGKVAEVVRIVSECDEPLTANQVAHECGARNGREKQAITRALSAARSQGLLETVKVMRRGREFDGYRAPDPSMGQQGTEGVPSLALESTGHGTPLVRTGVPSVPCSTVDSTEDPAGPVPCSPVDSTEDDPVHSTEDDPVPCSTEDPAGLRLELQEAAAVRAEALGVAEWVRDARDGDRFDRGETEAAAGRG